MSLAEIKERITELTQEERLEVAALIVHLNRMDDAQYQVELDRRLAAMDGGQKFRQADLERMHHELGAPPS